MCAVTRGDVLALLTFRCIVSVDEKSNTALFHLCEDRSFAVVRLTGPAHHEGRGSGGGFGGRRYLDGGRGVAKGIYLPFWVECYVLPRFQKPPADQKNTSLFPGVRHSWEERTSRSPLLTRESKYRKMYADTVRDQRLRSCTTERANDATIVSLLALAHFWADFFGAREASETRQDRACEHMHRCLRVTICFVHYKPRNLDRRDAAYNARPK